MISILSIQFNDENPSYLGIEQSDFFRSKSKEHNLMQFPYSIPMSAHKLFQCNMHVFLFDFLNVNMNKRKYAHTINQAYIRMKTFTTVLTRRKIRLYDTFFRMKINQLYPNFDYWLIITKKTWRNIKQSNQSWSNQEIKTHFLRHNIHWSVNKQSNIEKLAKNLSKGGKTDPRRISATQSWRHCASKHCP